MFTFGFYDSLNGDRKYNAQQISSLFDGIIEDGVYANVGELFAVIPGTGLQVVVKTGRAWFNHTWNLNDSLLPLTIETPDVLRPRIDSVVIEVNTNLEIRENSIKIIKGTPSTSPVPPDLKNDEGIYQHLLANVTVDANATAIAESKIENKVGQGGAPFVISPVKSVPIDDLFNQWEGEFNEWFENLKSQLTDNVVANLQKQIDEKLNLEDMATEEDILNGTPNKWIDAGNFSKSKASLLSLPFGSIVESKYENLEKKYPGMFMACDQRVVTDEAIIAKITELHGNVRPSPVVDVTDVMTKSLINFADILNKRVGNIEWGNKVVFVSNTKLGIYNSETNELIASITLPKSPTAYFVSDGYAILLVSNDATYYRVLLDSPYGIEILTLSSRINISNSERIFTYRNSSDQYVFSIRSAYNSGNSVLASQLYSPIQVVHTNDNFHTNNVYTIPLNITDAASKVVFFNNINSNGVYIENDGDSVWNFRKAAVVYNDKLYIFTASKNQMEIRSVTDSTRARDPAAPDGGATTWSTFDIYVRIISFSKTSGSEEIRKITLNLSESFPDFTLSINKTFYPISYVLLDNVVEILLYTDIAATHTCYALAAIHINLDTFAIDFKVVGDPKAIFGYTTSGIETRPTMLFVKNVHIDRYGADGGLIVVKNVVEAGLPLLEGGKTPSSTFTYQNERVVSPIGVLDFTVDTPTIEELYPNPVGLDTVTNTTFDDSYIVSHHGNIITAFKHPSYSTPIEGTTIPTPFLVYCQPPDYLYEIYSERNCTIDVETFNQVISFLFGNDSGKCTILLAYPSLTSSNVLPALSAMFRTSFGIYYLNTSSDRNYLLRYDNKSYVMPYKINHYMKIAD